MGLRERIQLARLAVSLDPGQGGLGERAHELFGAGVDLLQLHPPTHSPITDAGLAEAIEVVRIAAYDHQGLVSVTDAVEVAAEAGVDVVHLEQSPLTAKAAAARQHEWALVGRSCHSRTEVDDAIADPDVDYFFADPDLIGYAAKGAPPSAREATPWFATGAIALDDLEKVLRLGARRVCIDGGSDPDPPALARELERALRRAWRADSDLPELGLSPNSNTRARFRRPGEPPLRWTR